MRIIEQLRAATSLLATGLPWLERTYQVLPVTQRVREDALFAAMLATLLCVLASAEQGDNRPCHHVQAMVVPSTEDPG